MLDITSKFCNFFLRPRSYLIKAYNRQQELCNSHVSIRTGKRFTKSESFWRQGKPRVQALKSVLTWGKNQQIISLVSLVPITSSKYNRPQEYQGPVLSTNVGGKYFCTNISCWITFHRQAHNHTILPAFFI